MKTIRKIHADNLVIEFVKTKKQYIIGLNTKSLPNKCSFGSKPPRIGVKAAETDGKVVRLFEWKGKKNGWVQINEFKPTFVEETNSKVYYKTQTKWVHEDIIKQKSEITIYFDGGHVTTSNADEALDYIFGRKDLPETNMSTFREEKTLSLLNIPDFKLSGEQLVEKMQVEMSMGICPF